MSDPFLAVDWGTTNRRVYRIEDGAVTATARDACGVATMTREAYPAALAQLRSSHGDLPVLLAGMVGSTIGWHEAGYVPLPAGLAALSRALLRIDGRTAIVPGVARDKADRPDVMRGEEVQLLGAAAASLVPADALLCQPGTHCKWATLRDGAIVDFVTAMTGELFALLGSHSVLAPQLGTEVRPGAAFLEGVVRGSEQDLAAALFGVRAAGVLGRRDPPEAAAYASGVLIGSDVAMRLRGHGLERVYVLADDRLASLYCAAIAALGGAAEKVDSHAAFVAGITAIWEQSR